MNKISFAVITEFRGPPWHGVLILFYSLPLERCNNFRLVSPRRYFLVHHPVRESPVTLPKYIAMRTMYHSRRYISATPAGNMWSIQYHWSAHWTFPVNTYIHTYVQLKLSCVIMCMCMCVYVRVLSGDTFTARNSSLPSIVCVNLSGEKFVNIGIASDTFSCHS